MSHTKMPDAQLTEILAQYVKAPGDVWVRITRDCQNARKDLRELLDLLDSKADSNVLQAKVESFRKYYEWEKSTEKPKPAPAMKYFS